MQKSTVYCKPEAACIDLTEKEADILSRSIKTGLFPFSANRKALSLGDTDGFVKMISDGKTREAPGVHMVGPHVTKMISGISLAMKMEVTVEEIASAIHPHPTLNEAIFETAHGSMGQFIHY